MPCFFPLQAVKTSEGVKIGGSRDRLTQQVSDFFDVPCGVCVGCQKSRAREWAIRCALELPLHPAACWATLTYSDEHLPPTLVKRHLQLFLKRLRARLPESRIRFFAAGEYGGTTFRPHYHPILFGTSDEKAIVKSWPFGFAQVHELRPEAIAYVAGYVNKKCGPQEVAEERIDYRTGEVYQFQPEFKLMSRRPGIGAEAKKHWRSWRDHAYYLGKKVPVPRFYHEVWKQEAAVELLFDLWQERREARKAKEPFDYDRALAGAEIAVAQLSHLDRRRKL